MLAHVAPMGGRVDQVGFHRLERAAHLRHPQFHQPRVAIGAAALIGHPPGAQITFLEDMHGDAARAGLLDRLGME